MKLTVSLSLLCIAFTSIAHSQKATIREQKISMKTYMFSDPDPVPDMVKNYPYFKFDGFTNKGTTKDWNMVILENDFLKVHVCTDIGGKIWGAIEKSTGGEFLYFNDVVKFRDVAHRGPWTSGGIEFNFGIMSHVSTCSTPQDYVLKNNTDGSVSCVIGAIDLHTRTKWNVEIRLPADRAYFETTASWFNTGNMPVTYYHYMNAAAKTEGNLEFLYPGSHHIGHQGEVGEWPIDRGIDISFYNNNDFGSYKSYHVLNAYSDYFGGYWHDENFGFGRWGHYDDMPGKKLWIWGLADEGEIWVDLLTDSKGQYIEFQSGKSFNQAMEKSSLTPFKHREFIPYDADITRELWFPLKGTGGMVAASEHGVLNVSRKGASVEIILSALQEIHAPLVVESDGEMLREEMVNLKPLELFSTSAEIDPSSDFTVRLGKELLSYSSRREDLILDRPLEPNPDFDWNSAMGLFVKGFELEKQQSYIDGGLANRKAHELYTKSLELDPAFPPALNRLAFSFYRRMDYQKALEYTLQSMAIDTYDPEANYLFGLIHTKMGNSANARSGFSIAVQSPLYRTAAYTELARLNLLDKKLNKSREYANKALAYNQYNVAALEMLAIVYRQQGNIEMAAGILEKLYGLDATSAFVSYEKALAGEADKNNLAELISNELPFESYLHLAIKYVHYGFPEESIKILKASPKQAIVLIWLAFLDKEHSGEWLESALEMPPDFVFPYREETYVVLDHFMQTHDHWKLKYYTALICWKKDLVDRARTLLQECGDRPDYAPFYLAKAKLFEDNTDINRAALRKASSLDKDNWRVNLALVEQYLEEGKFEPAADLAGKTLDDYPERSILGLNYAAALFKLGEYKKCVDFLESYEVIPFEGAVQGRVIYHEAAISAALNELHGKDYKKAVIYAEKASRWPRNLGAGRPYNPDERLENFILAHSYAQMGRKSEAETSYARVIDYKPEDHQQDNALLHLQVLTLKKEGRQDEVPGMIQAAVQKDPHNLHLKWVEAMETGNKTEAFTKEMMEKESQSPSTGNFFLLLIELLAMLD